MDDLPIESAGFGIRVAGRLIDYLVPMFAGAVSGAFLALIAGVIAGATQRTASQVFETMTKSGALTYVGSIVATIIYHSFTESIGGASLGKRLFGLEVVSETLRPATLRQTFVRNLAFFIDGFFFGLIAYNAMEKSPTKQRLGDEWAKTRVVFRRSLAPEQRRDTRVFVFVLLGAIALSAEVLLVTHLCAYWLFA